MPRHRDAPPDATPPDATPDVHGLHDSLWYATAAPAPRTAPLDGDRRADVVVVGGGFTGCSTALHLAQDGADVVVLEANEIGWGGSGRNAGLCNAGLWLDPEEVVARLGQRHGPNLVVELGKAPQLVFDLVRRYGIDCDLERTGVMRAAFSAAHLRALEVHAHQWRERGANIELIDAAGAREMLGTTRYHGAIVDHRSATIQPLSYARGLARAAQAEGAAVHTGTPARALERDGQGWRVVTPSGTIRTETVVLATNAYSGNLWPGLRQSTIPIGCFACATVPLGENIATTVLPAGRAMYDTQPAIYFARLDRERRLILGSLGYPRIGDLANRRGWPNRVLRWLFPQLEGIEWEHHWSGTIGFTPDHIPRLHAPAPGLCAVLGYNGRGIAPGTFFGRTLARWVGGAPEAELPLPLGPVRPIAFRRARQLFYQTAFRASRLRSLLG